MRTWITLLACIIAFNTSFASEQQPAVRKDIKGKPAKTSLSKSAQTSASTPLSEAHAWLASINYVMTIDRVPELKRLRLQMYGSFNGVSTQQLISNDNMRHIKVLTKLEELALPTWTNDAGLSNIAGLTRLKNLNVPISNITDAGMAHLKDLNALEFVVLHKTKISGNGLQYLQGKPLRILGLNQTNIGDADMQTIAGLTGLETLFLVGTKVTDASVPHLSKLKNLKRLDITGTKISAQGKQQIQSAIPGIKIY